MRTAISDLREFVAGKSFADFQKDRMAQAAVERKFEVLGKAMYRLRNAHEEIFDAIENGHRIIGMRNNIAHGYDVLDERILWEAIERDLGGVENDLSSVIQTVKGSYDQ
ncbi:MAG: DUF86 domain-containing protein [Opitutales bacterium]|nr:DUF86 domain-containing protein [Opitutales bacterium]NRA27667.1 DUF86 domain-containing protein [Opitutales bacterium]